MQVLTKKNAHSAADVSDIVGVRDTAATLPLVASAFSYSMPVTNITDDIVRPPGTTATPEHEPVLTRVDDVGPPVASHDAAQAHVKIDSNLQRELALVEHFVVAGKDVDVQFIPYLSKGQRKKIAQKGYQTRSRCSPPTPPQWSSFIGIFKVLGIRILEFPVVIFIVLINLYSYLLPSLWCHFLPYLFGWIPYLQFWCFSQIA
jgi:hypothetical protein